jgi:hypothetical protein
MIEKFFFAVVSRLFMKGTNLQRLFRNFKGI